MATEKIADLLKRTKGGMNLDVKSKLTSSAYLAIEKYKDLPNFLKIFNPSLQDTCCRNEERSVMGSCPSLVNINNAFGEGSAEAWLKIQLADLNEYCGGKDKLTIEQIRECANTIVTCYPTLKATELMIVFKNYKAGKDGKQYGSLNPKNLCAYINEWKEHRNHVISQYEMIEAQKKSKIDRSNCITFEDWEEFKMLVKAEKIKDYTEYLTYKRNKEK